MNECVKRVLFLHEMTAKLQGVLRREQNELLFKRIYIASKVPIENTLGLNVMFTMDARSTIKYNKNNVTDMSREE